MSGLIGLSATTVSAQDAAKLAVANTAFAFDLFKPIAKDQPRENIFISPSSISRIRNGVQRVSAGADVRDG